MSEYDDNGFALYQEETTDPGPSVLIATIILCLLMLAVLPLLLSVASKWKQKKEDEVASTDSEERNVPDALGLTTLKQSPSDDDGSVSSHRSTASSVAQVVLNAILDSNPHSGPNFTRQRATVEKREIQLENEENSVDSNSIVQNDSDPTGDANSVGGVSALSKLDHDEVSIRDAIDAQDGTRTGDVKEKKEKLPFWKPAAWTETFDQLLEIAEYDYEMKRICKLAFPFTMEALLRGLLETVNVALIGRFIGTSSITAYVTVDMLIGLTNSLLSGFGESLTTLCSQAIGARNKKLAGQYVQLSIVLYLIFFFPCLIFWMLYMGNALRWFGFDEETVSLGEDFTKIYLFVQVIDTVSESIHALLDTIDREAYSSIVGIIEEGFATLGVLIVVLSNEPTLEKVGVVFLFVAACGMFFNVLFIMWKGWYDPFLPGIVGSFALFNWKAVKLMMKTSSALSFGFLLAYGEWELLTIFAKFLGPAEVAAWAILGTLWDVFEDVTESVADACEVRVALLLGAGRPRKACMSANKATYLGVFLALFLSCFLFILGDNIPTLLTTDPTLQRLLAELIPLFGIGNVCLTVGTMAWTAVGAQGRYRLATLVGFSGSWLLTIPLAAISSVVMNIDLQGQTAAVVIGYMASGTINAYLLFTSDWERLSEEVIAANGDLSFDSSSSSSSSSSSDGSSMENSKQSALRKQVDELVGEYSIEEKKKENETPAGMDVRIQE